MKSPMTLAWRALAPLQWFFAIESAGAIVLFAAAAASIAWANLSPETYHTFFEAPLTIGFGDRTLSVTPRAIIVDGLMTLFFFVVGLEIKRELTRGELRMPSRALLPLFAAAGGMLGPALIYLAWNPSGPASAGWGIPVATDIAFSLGCLALVRSRVPYSLVVFLMALAIFDDIGGILVIAVFYGQSFSLVGLGLAALVALLAFGLNRFGVRSWAPYIVVGVLLWLGLHRAGIHPGLAGVLLALFVPSREKDGHTPLVDRLLTPLAPISAYVVMPLFALASAGVTLRGPLLSTLGTPVTLGIVMALYFGKPLGIFLTTRLIVASRATPMPVGATPIKLLGVGSVAGIGFTVALFVAELAFPGQPGLLEQAKLGIVVGSIASGLTGAMVLAGTRRV